LFAQDLLNVYFSSLRCGAVAQKGFKGAGASGRRRRFARRGEPGCFRSQNERKSDLPFFTLLRKLIRTAGFKISARCPGWALLLHKFALICAAPIASIWRMVRTFGKKQVGSSAMLTSATRSKPKKLIHCAFIVGFAAGSLVNGPPLAGRHAGRFGDRRQICGGFLTVMSCSKSAPLDQAL
jgi:hypothetical protein